MSISKQRIIQYEMENPSELTAEQFSKLKQEIKNRKKGTISDELVDFMLWDRGLPSRQESFAKYVCKFLPKECSVLEVGCGITGKMSRILKNNGYNISCMDPKVDPSYLQGIKSFQEMFDYKTTNIEEYDYIIAQEPCDATEHIVRACVMKRKKLIMSMCGVPHKLISGEMLSSAQEWYSYLQNISPSDLKLRYANLDPLTTTPILKSNFF